MVDDREPRLTRPALLVLAALLERPREEFSGADIRRLTGIATGTLYPILMRLEDAGWLGSRWEEVEPREVGRPRKRLYLLTGYGVVKAKAATTLSPRSMGTHAWA
jgi:DNA-binding PadR family transcriptional regulator